jgi:hypothetical protein
MIGGGFAGALAGLIYALLTIVPGSAAGVESVGYFVLPLFGAVLGVPLGYITSRILRSK